MDASAFFARVSKFQFQLKQYKYNIKCTTMAPPPKQQGSRWLADLDIYRKLPTDLLESSAEGNIFSWFVLVCIAGLLFRETVEFMSPKLVTDLSIDARRSNMESKMQVNFNITMLDLRCQVRVNVFFAWMAPGNLNDSTLIVCTLHIIHSLSVCYHQCDICIG
jgi:hypothetical protein